MFASLLPGIRELRAPLAAGYIWLAFFYLVLGTPDELTDLPDPVEDLAMAADAFGSAATVAALSFVAYLIGSISQDIFGRVLPVGLEFVAGWLEYVSRRLMRELNLSEYLWSALRELPDIVHRVVLGEADPGTLDAWRSEGISRIQAATQLISEMREAGASEAEKPEALRPMIEAEETLRTSIVPPLAALSAAITLSSPWLGVVGLIFSLGLYVQAAARRIEARRLIIAFRRGREFEDVERDLAQIRSNLVRRDPEAVVELRSVSWDRLFDKLEQTTGRVGPWPRSLAGEPSPEPRQSE